MQRFRFLVLFLLATVSIAPHLTAAGNPGSADPKERLAALRGGEWAQGIVVVKYAPAARAYLSKSSAALPAASAAFLRYGVHETVQMYPSHRQSFAPDGRELGLDRMYRVSYSSTADPIEVARALSEIPGIEYAEPERIHRLAYVPDDAMLSSQYALDLMDIKRAWDITKGSRSVIIGVVDSGVLWTHEDLRENVYINPGEDTNGDGKYTTADNNSKDDDNNGYVDDVIGIDFAGKDGNGGGGYYDNNPSPTATGNTHGTHVAGIMAAIGNNAKGVAGVAFQCRYLPVKCGTDNAGDRILRGYDGIMYAADMGATVINCSWGGEGGYLQSEIDRIEYALGKGAVVVAAAGNNGRDGIFTPAAYPNLLSVASVGSGDRVSSFSNYSTWVDVSAPGDNIMSTLSSTTSAYGGMSGTSMASPNAAGVVALVASHRPELRGRALLEQVRVTSDNIDAGNNARYTRKIGYGRVNAYSALTKSLPSVRMTWSQISDTARGNGNAVFDRGEVLEVAMRWKNFLSTTKNATVTLTTKSPHVTILNGTFQLGALAAGEETGNTASPFVIQLADVEAYNEQIDLFFTITDDGYDDYGGISFIWQPTYRDHTVNDVTTTISNDGNIGFDDFSGVRGKGFIYRGNGVNVLFEGGLMIGAKVAGIPMVVDVVRNESGSVQCADFIGAAPVDMRTPGARAAQEGETEFTDDNAPLGNKIGLRVRLHSYEFTDTELANAVILRYTIHNTSQDVLEDLHAGLYFDWDIGPSASSDISDFDTTTLTGYAYDINKQVPTMIGTTVLTREKPTHFMTIANPDPDTDPPVFGIHNGYTKDEKWRSISSGIWHTRSVFTDISQVIANGPYTLRPGDSAVVAFALTAGLKVADVLATTPKVLDKWREIISVTSVSDPDFAIRGLRILSIAPHPLRADDGAGLMLSYSLDTEGSVDVAVFDALGRVAARFPAVDRIAGLHTERLPLRGLAAGSYLVRVSTQRAAASAKLIVR